MKNKLKIWFSDFWGDWQFDDNYFYNLLSTKYDVVLHKENPDILIFSCFSDVHKSYDGGKTIKVQFLAENMRPDFNNCHYAINFDYMDGEKNYRLPLWALHLNWFDRPYRPERDQAYLHNVNDFLNKNISKVPKSKFCSFVASQTKGKRLEFVPKLYQYKKIDCAGAVYQNVPRISGRGDEIQKVIFLNDYKFNISFENSTHPGYCTEKIIHSMFANCIPVYWGDPLVHQDFNENSFLNWHKFGSDEAFIEQIIKIDNDANLYKDIINQPWFKDNKIPDFVQPESVLSFFEKFI